MIPGEIFAEDLMATLIRYGLYIGAIFQIICLVASVTLTDEPYEYNNVYYDKVTTDSDECSSEQSSPGHRASLVGKNRKQEKKKRR